MIDDEELLNKVRAELNPDIGEGHFWEERALVSLLLDEVLFANSRKFLDMDTSVGPPYSLDGKPREETIVLFVICNDLFYWGCADCECIKMSELPELYRLHSANRAWGSQKWCCLKRKLRPQVPIVTSMKSDGYWDDELEALPAPEPS